MQITDAEKLILTMLCDIHEKLGITNSVDPEFVRSAIDDGNLWALKWEYPGVFHDSEPSPELVSETTKIMDMWSMIENSFQELSTEEKARVVKEAKLFGESPKFPGFDANNESEHFSVARFLVEKMDRFQEYKGRDFNHHFPTIDGHRRMTGSYEPSGARSLTADELIGLLNRRNAK